MAGPIFVGGVGGDQGDWRTNNLQNTVFVGGIGDSGAFASAQRAALSKINNSTSTGKSAKRGATKENTDSKRSDELKALNLVPFEALNKSQQYANAGDTMPIVFCLRENDAGGVWISPPLLDSSSDNFEQSFLYLIGHGQTGIGLSGGDDYFVGNQCLADVSAASGITWSFPYTNNPAVCPISTFPITCDHTNFNFLADPLPAEVGETILIRTVNRYATGVTIRFKPIYPDGLFSPTTLERYTLTVTRKNNTTLVTTTVGTVNTNATGGITSITDTMSADNYTYQIENTAIHTASTYKPAAILIEFRQANTFPTSYDRTTSYTNIQLLGIEANLYDLKKAYSVPAELKQLHVFMRQGLFVDRWRFSTPSISTGTITGTTGASNRFADLVYWWFQNSGKYPNQNWSYFSVRGVATCALFHSTYNITYNAYLTSSNSFLSYAQTIAPMLLCSMFSFLGDYAMKPLLPLADNGTILVTALTAKEVFTDSDTNPDSLVNNIIAGSYSKQYKNTEDLVPVNVVVTWRGQDNFNLETNKTTTVRYSDYSATAPEEVYDMTEFCTNVDHATIFAKYILATRRYSLHTISFQTARNVGISFLEPLDVISVTLTRTNSAGNVRQETEFYLVDSLEFDQSGIVTVTASQFPVNNAGASIISNSILSGSFVVTT